jgi:RNA helicase HrpA
MKYKDLPVYKQREKILNALKSSQVVVIESPTGSGKTTQLPVILYEAGYADGGMIGVTQPRRIAALSVSDFIAKQLNTPMPGLVGYKMRFEDKTLAETKIKIMTDGILLQELKNDRLLTKYNVIIVDEAHERSLNIDFILGLLKGIIEVRPDFKVIISSATINAEVFSEYFDGCPVVHIDTVIYPVQVIYDLPRDPKEEFAVQNKVADIVERIIDEKRKGDILVFLSGEQAIKDCINILDSLPCRKKLHILPLYGRLGKEEQERVFERAPRGKTKVVVATNIAETSVTIDGITAVIDSGLAKINYYNPRTFTSSLVEMPISKASCNQRKGRAGRTQPGTCYRLYDKRDFESRPMFTTEEIYRTDLSEVVLRMAELGITDYESFDFISTPGKAAIASAVQTLKLLDAIDDELKLSKIGKMMIEFPLLPRHARIIVEGILSYPDVLEELLIATSFISTNSPFILPPGEEMDARKAHHSFRDPLGDFLSYLKLYRAFVASEDKEKFALTYYLDIKAMEEIVNIKEQLEEIVSDMGIPVSHGGAVEDYLCAIAKGLIQFVCVRSGRGVYRSLTAEKISIHPGSVMFNMEPQYIVAGEIVKTSRMFARSVSVLKREWLPRISADLPERLGSGVRRLAPEGGVQKQRKKESTWEITIGGEKFSLEAYKGKKKIAVLPWERVSKLLSRKDASIPELGKKLKAKLIYDGIDILSGESINTVLKAVPLLPHDGKIRTSLPQRKNFTIPKDIESLVSDLMHILSVTLISGKKKEKGPGFLTLYTNGSGLYWIKPVRGFHTAVTESLASLEKLADECADGIDKELLKTVNEVYRRLSTFFE